MANPTDKDTYVFTRDFRDNNRINLQHYLWVELFGYHIHPSIPTDSPNLRIADVGTGTGIWLTDLARRLPPSTALDGFDISLAAAPPPQCLPANITLQHWDLLADEVPSHLRGTYDIVNMRLLVLVISDDQIERVIEKLVQLLSATNRPPPNLRAGHDNLAHRVRPAERARPGVRSPLGAKPQGARVPIHANLGAASGVNPVQSRTAQCAVRRQKRTAGHGARAARVQPHHLGAGGAQDKESAVGGAN
ncbi:class I SAM-dependent methyltransferase [Aspergillus mulundensis]|uniref:Uncharacterized protein n=1 Tax=Aspergillus mulundensis TaxID=1810919 RepID=A0A3D8SDF9_9EURO|nr:hypothetical protein DSM5745_04124 [Aspergillus mulundensis]RDW83798.1 hypothetical protein DSM5745_04124 [Aspergillus mulundensis]